MNRQWYSVESFKMHRRNLEEIGAKGSERIDNVVPKSIEYAKIQNKGYAVHRKQQSMEIYKENQKILNRIEQISNRSMNFNSSFPSSSSIYTLKKINNSKKQSQSPKKPLKIYKSPTKSDISAKKLLEAYKETLNHKKILKKRSFLTYSLKVIKKLPPIKYPLIDKTCV